MNPLDASQLWWDEEIEEDERHSKIFEYVRTLENNQREIQQRHFRNALLYDPNAKLMGSEGLLLEQGPSTPYDHGVVENVLKSVIDTAMSLIAKNRPRATFVTSGGDWKTQRKAKQLERFVEAEFHRLQVYRDTVRMFRDACVFGLGALKMFTADGRVVIDRVMPDELLVDENECRAAEPRQLHQRKFVDREVLKAQFPEDSDAIDAAHGEDRAAWTSFRTVPKGQVAVIESWHLESGEGYGDGLHGIYIQGKTLFEETWTKKKFPFVFYRWGERITGFYGCGLAEDLCSLQLRVNKLNRLIARSVDLNGMSRWWAHVSDSHLRDTIRNQPGMVNFYRGPQAPTLQAPPVVPGEVYQEKERLISRMYQLAGVSQSSAQSTKPPDLESAAALREYNDQGTERFSIQAQNYEHAHLDVSENIVELQRELSGNRTVAVWNSRDLLRRIPWKECDLERDMYQMSVEASSILSRTPAGRLQAAIEMTQSGLMRPEAALRLLGHPDIEREVDLETAAIEDIEATIEDLLDGVYHPPEPFQDLKLGVVRVQMAYLKARRDDAPEDILEGLRQWIELAQDALTSPTPPAQPTEPGMTSGPYNPNLSAPVGAPGGAAPGAPNGGPPPPLS